MNELPSALLHSPPPFSARLPSAIRLAGCLKRDRAIIQGKRRERRKRPGLLPFRSRTERSYAGGRIHARRMPSGAVPLSGSSRRPIRKKAALAIQSRSASVHGISDGEEASAHARAKSVNIWSCSFALMCRLNMIIELASNQQ